MCAHGYTIAPPGNRISHFLSSIHNRLEVVFQVAIYPLYVSTMNYKTHVELPLLEDEHDRPHSAGQVFKFLDIKSDLQRHLQGRAKTLPIVLPSGAPEG